MFKRDILRLVKTNDNPGILDVGCFKGDYLQILLNNSTGAEFKYVGIDVTPNYIEYARNRFINNTGNNHEFKLGNVFEIDEHSDSFDVVLFTDVLHHLPELRRPISEVFRVSSKFVLIGLYIHDSNKNENVQIKNGFLYKTWSREHILSELEMFGSIHSISYHPSPDYDYLHSSVILKKLKHCSNTKT